ncbi:Catalase [Faunimonas pinastri]|uniref:Catalase n=1 Tax=Faunimonas pinastri TaxID=1855383 RepID=A0A1H9JY05_9HYPH|nr:catalase family protein [Faunimonas pinastri]SEQ91861.1 Catalase [Faunimonas pinastri]
MTAPASPVRFDPSVEQPAPDEAETIQSILDSMRYVVETTYKDGGHGLRSVHAKSHGLLQGEVRVLGGLPAVLSQGVFAQAKTYPVVMRFSTNPGDILDDSVSTPRGLAIKMIGVEGERLPGSEGDATQDFVMVNGPVFNASTPKQFAGNLKLLAATTDRAQGLKKVFSAAARGLEWALEEVGTKSPTLTGLGGQPETHPLGEAFYTQVPIRYGNYIAKLSIAPVSPELRDLKDAPLNVNGKPNGLRDAIGEFFAEHGGEWEIRVQLCTDLETMPIEDASVRWPEEESPYVPVARISVQPQPSWTEERSRTVDDGYSFRPWHGIAAHQPLGGVMRVRKPVYEDIVGLRSKLNGCPIHEPARLDKLPA